ncbi:hypothetical protein PTKIN_Ptkin12aG0089000 [Pterospermum kingtungense]
MILLQLRPSKLLLSKWGDETCPEPGTVVKQKDYHQQVSVQCACSFSRLSEEEKKKDGEELEFQHYVNMKYCCKKMLKTCILLFFSL